jgi:GTPase SAR1 family protein
MYRNIIPIYFKGAVFAILVFAMNDRKSFESLESWLGEISLHSDSDIGIVLVGSKYDVKDKTIEDMEAKKFAADHNLTLFYSSAVTGQSVGAILEHIALAQMHGRKVLSTPLGVSIDKRVQDPSSKGGKKGCC